MARGSLNDMIVAADGTAYLGDMGHRVQGHGGERRPGQTFVRAARRQRGGSAADDLDLAERPRADRRRSHADRRRERWRAITAFDVAADGTLARSPRVRRA